MPQFPKLGLMKELQGNFLNAEEFMAKLCGKPINTNRSKTSDTH